MARWLIPANGMRLSPSEAVEILYPNSAAHALPLRLSRGEKLPHHRALDFQILQLACHRHGVFGKLRQALLRQISPARIADQYARADRGVAIKKGQRARRGVALIEKVANQNDIVA